MDYISSYMYGVNLQKNNCPIMRYKDGEDFYLWQKKARNKLYELLGLDKMIKTDDSFVIESEGLQRGFKKIRFSFESEPGYRIPCVMLLPEELKKKAPVMICLQGHSTGMHNSYGEEKFERDRQMNAAVPERAIALEGTKRGYITISIEQRYMGELGSDEEGNADCTKGKANHILMLGRCAIGERVWDISRLIDVIEKHLPYADSEDITCNGGSGGGTISFYAAAIDERIKTTMPDIAVCGFQESIIQLYHCPCNYIPHITEYFDMGDIGGLIAPRIFVMTNGKKDDIFPIESATNTARLISELYKKCGAENNFAFCQGEEGHRAYTHISFNALEKILSQNVKEKNNDAKYKRFNQRYDS